MEIAMTITRDSLMTLEAYAKARPAMREQVMAHKKLRRVALGILQGQSRAIEHQTSLRELEGRDIARVHLRGEFLDGFVVELLFGFEQADVLAGTVEFEHGGTDTRASGPGS